MIWRSHPCRQSSLANNQTVWTPSRIESRSATLDLSASAQGHCTVRQVVCDDVIVCNAADFIDWSARAVQFEVFNKKLGKLTLEKSIDVLMDSSAHYQRISK